MEKCACRKIRANFDNKESEVRTLKVRSHAAASNESAQVPDKIVLFPFNSLCVPKNKHTSGTHRSEACHGEPQGQLANR